ncbi:uncharacterized protein LOC101452237 [Ceratitis capitata]|uniref:(Mediterranean fruit fly) hypothetical protein n=1 Tax=Ceratitis capitata TaxID=7213 RepID=A0A811V055_CERCA|nr:uncharacterized protein LOC101452237 [Ceratitis capitata]XP_004526822.1 uncharacterized protein LOC101452237 [Ceratitis capitata]XP_004526823.1 uncharacterized protein LOC101452237 [Ceratitis capitata]XP_020714982.1 uncharacterized protein LOC101452237 [Ceratitis capitata]CAD7004480.1 unnamed protein product [Ceratitis capitata]
MMHERRVEKVKGGHYVATHNQPMGYPPYTHSNRAYSTDGEESHNAASAVGYTATPEYPYSSARKMNLYQNHHAPADEGSVIYNQKWSNGSPQTRPFSTLSYDQGGDVSSEIYVTSAAYKEPSEISRYSHRPQSRGASHSVYSVASTAKTGQSARSTTKRGVKIDAMSAPNPFCPNIKGVCCLMLLLNLGLILVTLGFVIVVQFYEPLYVWILGIIFLIFGFLTLIGCMIYCVHVCRDAKTPSQVRNENLYWTRHWQNNIGYIPTKEISYKGNKYDGYSDHYSISKVSGKYSDRGSNHY